MINRRSIESRSKLPKLAVVGCGAVFALMSLFSATSMAQTKVVVIPLGGDEPPEVRAGSEIYTNSISMKFSLIPGGSFVMGSPAGTGDPTHRPIWPKEDGRSSLEIQHIVTLSNDFYMQTTEVTQAQYQQVMGSNPAYFSASGSGVDCGLDCPVEMVSWTEAQDFIDALNALENRSSCNSQPNTCYSLPTESQWEYAARGATNSAFYNGDITQPYGNDPNLNEIGWYSNNSDNTTHPVAQKQPNNWGLYDLSGNVMELCEDWSNAYPDGPVTDPVGVGSSTRIVRGGSWDYPAVFSRSASRLNAFSGVRNKNMGFRLALLSG